MYPAYSHVGTTTPEATIKKLFKLNFNSHQELRLHCFTVGVVSKWNSLPSDVVNAPSINAFKSRLEKHWSSREFRYDYKAKFES